MEPVAKRARVDTTFEQYASEVKGKVSKELTRDEMLEKIFHAWDHDGNETISFTEILPHYMKATNHRDQTEQEVRLSFARFCETRGLDQEIGISKETFKSWLAPMTDDAVARRFITAVLGVTREPYQMNVNFAVVKEYEGRSLNDIVDAAPHAVQGLAEHSDAMMAQLGLRTVRQMGRWKFYRLARAICTLAAKEEVGHTHAGSGINIRNALDTEYETCSLKELLSLPLSALAGFPPKCDCLLADIRIKTIEQLGNRKIFAWAAAITDLADLEQNADTEQKMRLGVGGS
jgi:hypothetical protein